MASIHVSFPKLPEMPENVVQPVEQGGTATYAKEMERLSAKESLLLALKAFLSNGGAFLTQFRDSRGFDALLTRKTIDMQRTDVNERIIALERLNPTPRLTTSSYLEGRWSFDWFGSGTPGFLAVRLIFEIFPSDLASLSNMNIVIKDANAKVTANIKLIFSKANLSVEGPLRMKEEYIEGIIETPTIIEEAVPAQLKGVLGQAVRTVQQLPVPITNAISNRLRIPFSRSFQRPFMISYLDEEILIIRDSAVVPEVLTRLDASVSPMEPSGEYES